MMPMSHLLLRPGFQELVEAFSRSFKVKITFFSPAMEVVASSCPESTFCSMVREDLGLVKLCLDMDRDMCSRASGTDRVTRYRCHAGLHEAILPVRMDGHILGYFMLGQYRDHLPMMDALRRHADRRGVDTAALAQAFDALPRYDQDSADGMLTLFSMLVTHVVSQHYIQEERGSLMARIEDQIQAALASGATFRLDLEQLAVDLCKSVSTISHHVKERTGMSFGQLAALRRVEAFEAWMASHPGATIKEGALRAGFDDPLYLSRVYRKVRGRPPKDFLAVIRST